MIIKKTCTSWLLRSIVCSALVMGLTACSSNDDSADNSSAADEMDQNAGDTDGSDTDEADTDGTDTDGTDTDGTDTDGTDTDGTDTDGGDTAGTDTDGGDTDGADTENTDGSNVDETAGQETENDDGTSTFIIPLSADQEVPPVDADAATGEGNLIIDRASGAISGSVAVSGLSGQATMAHIHQGVAGTNGGPLVVLSGNGDGSVWSVPADTTLDQAALLALGEGSLYLNIHTEANAGGELRGQIVPSGISLENSVLSGNNEVPPVPTDASGVGVSTVNLDSGAISATVIVTGLDAATMAHIHNGAAGTNGGVAIELERDSANPGIWRTPVPSTLTPEQIEAFESEELYFNVHSDANPGGEIRGQL